MDTQGRSPRFPGSWKDRDGTVYHDFNQAYLVFVAGLIAAALLILEAVAFAKTNYKQLAITVRYAGHAEIL